VDVAAADGGLTAAGEAAIGDAGLATGEASPPETYGFAVSARSSVKASYQTLPDAVAVITFARPSTRICEVPCGTSTPDNSWRTQVSVSFGAASADSAAVWITLSPCQNWSAIVGRKSGLHVHASIDAETFAPQVSGSTLTS